ncbi:MAG: sulfite exporter TauE/SafE family protein [Acidobacteria bacterium]|jgi:uncharacterized membrane protein YfcA|nr:MAG: sulfite exporter TauE/SafE family protein [Acidobacteriota bacterium]GIU80974.1 MAG: UPF0721 transmembrane protein [Pyrinomonadaceae bacterium]
MISPVVLGMILSGLIGLSLGLIGGGGSIITVPVLVYVLGVGVHEAVGMSLAVVGSTSFIGSVLHYQRGTVKLKTGLIFGVAGMIGALIGAPLTVLLSPSALMVTFALLMLLISLLMLYRKPNPSVATDEEKEIAPQKINPWKAFLAGFGVGILTGFLGVGGGFLIVPALVMFGGLGMKEAIGTSLFVIFLNCIAGLLGHASYGEFAWGLTILVTLSAVIGTIFGTLLSHRIAANKLQKGFAIFVLGVGIFILLKNYEVFFGK